MEIAKPPCAVDKIKIDLLIHEAKRYLIRKKKTTTKESWGAESEGLFQYCVPFTVFVILLKHQLRYYSIVAKCFVMVLNIDRKTG